MIRLIAAIDKKRGLAKDGQIPWDLPEDVARFKTLTQTHGSEVLMGRTTFDQFTTPLKSRHIYVVSHQNLNLPDNCTLVNDLDKFMGELKSDLWVAGGAEVFSDTINYADEIYLTIVDKDFGCDKFFPDYSNFKVKSSEAHFQNGLNFSYQLLTRF